jgi:hypothetical protein
MKDRIKSMMSHAITGLERGKKEEVQYECTTEAYKKKRRRDFGQKISYPLRTHS